MARHSKTSGGGPDAQDSSRTVKNVGGLSRTYNELQTTTYCVRSGRL